MASSSSTEFSDLPEGCVAHVLSLTTPRDACRFATISTVFRSAADSDAVWDRFLSDHLPTIAESDADTQKQLLDVHPKKQLFICLADSPVLIDGGSKSFLVEKASGKKCFMIAAREMAIVWGDTPEYWEWVSSPDSRFAEVAQLISVCWLELSLTIQASLLSPKTTYTPYLVFKMELDRGFEHTPIETSVGLTSGVKNTKTIFLAPLEGETRQLTRYFDYSGWARAPPSASSGGTNGRYPKFRADGWMEAELGECFVEGGGDDDGDLVEVSVLEVKRGHWKQGLVIQGIEFRPKA
ncbi:unnamed protein product [Rhodiola kirilowii]